MSVSGAEVKTCRALDGKLLKNGGVCFFFVFFFVCRNNVIVNGNE